MWWYTAKQKQPTNIRKMPKYCECEANCDIKWINKHVIRIWILLLRAFSFESMRVYLIDDISNKDVSSSVNCCILGYSNNPQSIPNGNKLSFHRNLSLSKCHDNNKCPCLIFQSNNISHFIFQPNYMQFLIRDRFFFYLIYVTFLPILAWLLPLFSMFRIG